MRARAKSARRARPPSFRTVKPPQVADYSIRKTYGRLLDMFENAFTRNEPAVHVCRCTTRWPGTKGPTRAIDPFEKNRQKQVVGLIRTNFLKRFESSVVAFELSCDRLLEKLLAFLEVHSESDAEKKRLERWKTAERRHPWLRTQLTLDLWGEDGDEADDDDIVPPGDARQPSSSSTARSTRSTR